MRRLLFALLLLFAAAPAAQAEVMVATANPHASRAALSVLQRGGSAVDAAIAAQAALSLVEPQSSGIGGGAFMLHYEAGTGRIVAYDGRETAPAGAWADMFLHADGTPMAFYEAVVGGLSVGVPGVLRMLELAHADHGRLPWAEPFAPAIRLARQGFAVSPRLAGLIAEDRHLRAFPQAYAYFHDAAGRPLPAGHVLRNPALADTLEAVAQGGADAFYAGPVARDIAAAVQGAWTNPGTLGEADLAAYTARRRLPLCAIYRAFEVCGMPPPTSGGVASLQILGLLSAFDMAEAGAGTAASAHLLAEAGRLAFADRAAWLGDADQVAVPVAGLLDPSYLAERARLIDRSRSMGRAEAGTPPGAPGGERPASVPEKGPSTTHFVIVDSDGDVVSMTSSVENAFGSRLMVRGFILNNQLTDFDFEPMRDGRSVPNAPGPGKRPRSSMSPTIVLDGEGAFRLAVGSPGGSRIIGYVARALVGVLDWGLPVQAAIDLPNVVNRNGATELEAGTEAEALRTALEAMGHEVRVAPMVSGLHGIEKVGGRLRGGADRRREGVVLSD